MGARLESLEPQMIESMPWGALEGVETCSDEILACWMVYVLPESARICYSAGASLQHLSGVLSRFFPVAL